MFKAAAALSFSYKLVRSPLNKSAQGTRTERRISDL